MSQRLDINRFWLWLAVVTGILWVISSALMLSWHDRHFGPAFVQSFVASALTYGGAFGGIAAALVASAHIFVATKSKVKAWAVGLVILFGIVLVTQYVGYSLPGVDRRMERIMDHG